MPYAEDATDHGPTTIHPSAEAGPALTAAQRRVAATLAEIDGATAAEITMLAGVSKSSVAKTLASLEQRDGAIRTIRERDGFRDADIWSPGPTLGALLSAGVTDPVSDRPASGLTAPPGNLEDDPGVESTAGPKGVPCPVPSAEVAATDTPSVQDRSRLVGGGKRLAAGELAAMVTVILEAHQDVEYTPTMLSHMLEGRSAGAIHNVLEKMVSSGTAVRTCDKPKRYRYAVPQAPGGARSAIQ